MSTERVGVYVELKGQAQKSLTTLREIDRLITSVNGKRVNVNVSGTQLDRILSELRQISSYVQAIAGRRVDVKADATQVRAADNEVKQLGRDINAQENKKITITAAFSGVSDVLSSISSMAGAVDQYATSLFGGIFSTIGRSLIAQLTSTVTEGLGMAVTRYDTFKTYPITMAALGFDEQAAETTLEALNQAVLGLPTGLHEIAALHKELAGITGELDNSAQYAIAINNALLAGTSDATQREMARRQLRDLLSAGTLLESEWSSLAKSIPLPLRLVASDLGLEGGVQGIKQALKSNEITANDVFDSLVKLGTNNGSIAELAGIQKNTIAGFISNMKIAFATVGQEILGGIDDAITESTGNSLATTLYDYFVPPIKSWAKEIADSIRENPSMITDLLDKLRSYDWQGLVSGIGKALDVWLKLISAMSKLPAPLLGFIMGGGFRRINEVTELFSRLSRRIGGFIKNAQAGTGAAGGLANGLKKLNGALAAKTGVGLAGYGALAMFGANIAYLVAMWNHEDALITKHKELMETLGETEKASEVQIGVTKEYVDELVRLNETADRTDEQQQRMAELVDLINEQFGSTVITIDESTGALENNTKQIYENVAAYEESVRRKIAADKQKALVEHLIEAENSADEAAGTYNEWRENGTTGEENLMEYEAHSKTAIQRANDVIDTYRDLEKAARESGNIDLAIDYNNRAQKYAKEQAELLGTTVKDGRLQYITDSTLAYAALSKELEHTTEAGENLSALSEESQALLSDLVKSAEGDSETLIELLAENGIAWESLSGDTKAAILEQAKQFKTKEEQETKSAEHTKQKTSEIKQSWFDLQTTLSSLDFSFDYGGLSSFFSSLREAFLGHIANLASSILSAWQGMQKVLNPFQSLVNSLGGNWNLTTDGTGPVITPYATGGEVEYRAAGGGFAPRGTDTVPAMLTPGEFVMRKGAVDSFGTRFMARINALDIDGAFNALAMRAGSMALAPMPFIVNTTKTTNHNNNQQLTQNIYNSSPSYVKMRAGRYIGAM